MNFSLKINFTVVLIIINFISVKGFSYTFYVETSDKRKMLSHSGERVEINVTDSSDIRAAIEELKNIQEKFEKEYSGDEK